MFCMKCGQPLEDGVIFCKFCGKRLETEPQPPPQQQPPSAQQPTAFQVARHAAKAPLSTGGIVAVGVAAAVLLGSAGFGLTRLGAGDRNDIAGKWVLDEVITDGSTMTAEEMSVASGEEIDVTFDFKENGNVVGTETGIDAGAGEGTYEIDGNQVLVAIDDDTLVMTFEDEKLAYEMADTTLVLVKEPSEGSGSDNEDDSPGGIFGGLFGESDDSDDSGGGSGQPGGGGSQPGSSGVEDESGEEGSDSGDEDDNGGAGDGAGEDDAGTDNEDSGNSEDGGEENADRDNSGDDGAANGADAWVVGKWVPFEVSMDGINLTVAQMEEMSGRTLYYTLDFMANGIVAGSKSEMGFLEGEADYEVAGDQVTLTDGDFTMTMIREGDLLVMEYEGARIVHAREGASPEATTGIVGAWLEDGGTECYVFKNDGTYALGQLSDDGNVEANFSGKYELNGSELMINYNIMSDELLGPLQVEFKDGRMAITNEYERGKIWYVPYGGPEVAQ